MRSLKLFGRMRSWLLGGGMDPVGYYGTVFKGTYELHDKRVSGGVADMGDVKRYPPVSILVVRNGNIIGSTTRLEEHANGWRFRLEVDPPVTAEDVLADRIAVFASDRRGALSELRIDGAHQLSYIRGVFAPAWETELDLDFSAGGNSKDYLRAGWSGAEPDFTWTEGKQSTVAITFAKPGDDYRIELLMWPFVVPDKLPQQTLTMWFSGILIGKFYLGPRQQLLECEIGSDLTQCGDGTLRLDLPNAARPCDLGVSGDNRTLALACKRLKLIRITGDQSG
jgi:hypothetical protein